MTDNNSYRQNIKKYSKYGQQSVID